MALNISILLVPWPIFLTALILIVAVIIVLTVMQKKLKKRVILKEEEEQTYFRRRLAASKSLSNDPPRFLGSLDSLAREFFETELKVIGAKYSDLIERFNQTNNGTAVKFCEVMQGSLYSGKMLDKEKLEFLFEKLDLMIRENEKSKVVGLQSKPKSEVILEPRKMEREETVLVNAAQDKIIEKREPIEELGEVHANIVEYLSEGRKRGFEDSSLKEKLLAAGFHDADIEKSITYLNDKDKEEQKQNKQEPPVKSIKEISAQRDYSIDPSDRTVMARFFHPKNKEIETIKKEVMGEEFVKPKKIEPAPYKKENVELKERPVYPSEEPSSYQYIGSFDNLDGVKEKIKEKKQNLATEGYGGAKLGNGP